MPAVITVVVLLVITVPLVAWILRIDREGTVAADVSKYETLVNEVSESVQRVEALLRNDTAALEAVGASSNSKRVTLIVPEVVMVDGPNDKKKNGLRIELEGIYWSPVNPLVGINGETLRVGDTIQGFTIVEIEKTKVKFKGSDGEIVVKGMYEDILSK